MDVMGMGVRLISNPFFWKYDVSEAGVGAAEGHIRPETSSA
jgi:hypothetical protein